MQGKLAAIVGVVAVFFFLQVGQGLAQDLDLSIFAPIVGYSGVSSTIGASVFSFSPDPVSDVTVTATVTGAFNFGSVVAFGPAFTCTNTPAPGGVTVTCYAGQFAPFEKGG
jgi:hypothetical protein